MNWLLRMDRFFIEETEAFCHKFQIWTGKTNFWLASRIYFLLACVVVGIVIWSFFPPFPLTVQVVVDFFHEAPIFISLMFVLLWWKAVFDWHRKEAEAFKRLIQGLANPEKNRRAFVTFRIIIELLCLYSLVSFLYQLLKGTVPFSNVWIVVLTMLLGWAAAILEACDPLPPCAGRLWERIRALFSSPANET